MTIPPEAKMRDNFQDDARTILDRYAQAWRGDAGVKSLKDTVP